MILRAGIVMVAALVSVTAQTASESNAAYRRFQAVRSTPEAVKAAEDWVRIYERQQPDPKSVPPYLSAARVFAERGVHMDEVPALLEKAVKELATPGGFTVALASTNSPFLGDQNRALIANVYTQIRRYDTARALLDTVSQKIAGTQTETFHPVTARNFEGLLFSYRDAVARLALAEGRKDEALAVEHSILTNPRNVAAARLIEEHRSIASQLWKELGRSDTEFTAWLSAAR